jgi:hypothetical protein
MILTIYLLYVILLPYFCQITSLTIAKKVLQSFHTFTCTGLCVQSGRYLTITSFMVQKRFIFEVVFIVWYYALPWKSNITKKVKLPLSMPWKHIGEDEVQLLTFLTTKLGKSKSLTLLTSCFDRGKQAPDTLWIKGSVDPGGGLGVLDNREMSCSSWESNPALYSP